MLVAYFGVSKSNPHQWKQIAWLVWWRNAYQWIWPTPPIIANLCARIYRENRYHYGPEDLPSKLDDKTYRHSAKFIKLWSWLISFINFRTCGWTLNFNGNIYEIHVIYDVSQHRQLDCCFKSLLRQTTRKHQGIESVVFCGGNPSLIGLLCYQNTTASCILHNFEYGWTYIN